MAMDGAVECLYVIMFCEYLVYCSCFIVPITLMQAPIPIQECEDQEARTLVTHCYIECSPVHLMWAGLNDIFRACMIQPHFAFLDLNK